MRRLLNPNVVGFSVGFAAIVVGVGLIYLPAALIAGGALLFGAALDLPGTSR